MSTSSSIAVMNTDGSVSAVYCHFDGYLEGVGSVLVKNHNSLELAQSLVGLGDLSSVDEDAVEAYHRDYMESWANVQPKVYENVDKYFDNVAKNISDDGYRYIFKEGNWYAWDTQAELWV